MKTCWLYFQPWFKWAIALALLVAFVVVAWWR